MGKTEDNISPVDPPCFGFFVWPCYIKRTHYPTLEKPGAQNKKVYQKSL